jgi:hypothetical protein
MKTIEKKYYVVCRKYKEGVFYLYETFKDYQTCYEYTKKIENCMLFPNKKMALKFAKKQNEVYKTFVEKVEITFNVFNI